MERRMAPHLMACPCGQERPSARKDARPPALHRGVALRFSGRNTDPKPRFLGRELAGVARGCGFALSQSSGSSPQSGRNAARAVSRGLPECEMTNLARGRRTTGLATGPKLT